MRDTDIPEVEIDDPRPRPNGATDHSSRHLRPIDLGDFLALVFPPRELVLAPWLPQGGLGMIHGPRGIAKTYVALNVAYAAATAGKFLTWQAPKRR